MFECLDAEAALDVLEHRLPAEKRVDVEAHLDECASCRQFMAELVRVHTLDEADGPEDVRSGPVSFRSGPVSFRSGPVSFRSGQHVGRYVLIEMAGAGAMGVVFSAYDPELDRKVAVKLLRGSSQTDSQRQRLRREAQAMAKVHHPNVAQVFDVGTHEGEVFIAMEFVAGTTATVWLRAKPRSWRAIVDVFLAAGRGVDAAHRADLVHRDFKPDNVLISESGHRVCVCDFGLVSPINDRKTPTAERVENQEVCTQEGALLGTPAYMAPEQLDGALADARSDQFSFCVALFEGLYGIRPFAGKTVQELRSSIREGNICERSPTTVPVQLRRVLLRGLQENPELRFASMGDLLRQLALVRTPKTRRRLALAAGLIVAMGAGTIGLASGSDGASGVCQGAEEAFAGVWNGDRRTAFTRAIEQGSSLETRSRLVEHVETRAERWKLQHVEACRATRVHKHQSEKVLGLRMACLQQQRIDLHAFLQEVEAGGGTRVDRALLVLDGLDEASRCADTATLGPRVGRLAQESSARDLELRQALAQVQAKMQLGLAESGLVAAEELMPKLLSANVPRLAAQGHAQLASLLEAAGRLGEAREMYESALSQSVGSADETQVAIVWIALVHLVGYTQGNLEVGRQLARVAEIALQRVPERDDLVLRLRGNVAMLASSEENLDEAEREFRFVAAGFERLLGQYHPRTLNALHNLGDVLRRRGKLEEARKIWQELLRVQEERFGPQHSSTASTLMQLGHDEYQRGQIHQALARYQRVLKIRISALGAESPQVAAAHTTVGLALSRNGAYDEAREHHQRALAIWTSTLGPEHSNVAIALNNLASTEYKAKNLEQARDLYREAYELRKASLGSEHISVATPLYNLGLVAKELNGNCTEAEPYWREVLSLRERSLDPEHPHLAFPLTSIGECLVERGEVAEARPLLERALAIRLKHASAPSIAAETRFALARALWPQSLQRQRALELAEAALSSLGSEPALAEMQLQVANWLSKRRR